MDVEILAETGGEAAMYAAAIIAAVLAMVPGHDTEVVPGIDGTAVRTVTEAVRATDASEETAAPVAEGTSLFYRAQQLWVDRNHANAQQQRQQDEAE